MGYRIEYGDQPVYWKKNGVNWRSVIWYSCISFGLFCFLTSCFWSSGREVMEQWFFPGDSYITKQALGHMACRLKEGESLGDAFLVFCRDIINGAQIPG